MRASATRASTPRASRSTATVEGFHAVVVQHECDHLIGRLYPTRMTDLRQLGFTSVLFPELDAAADD
jgi:peptide deformylase